MSQKDVSVNIRADTGRFNAAMRSAGAATRGFANMAKSELTGLKGAMNSVQGKLATLGVSIGVGKIVQDAAKFEKEMRLLQVASGGTRAEMEAWRADMLAHQRVTGTTVDAQLELSNSLQAAGLNIKQIRAVLGPASDTMAVARTNADSLGKALGVAAEQFGSEVDLSNIEHVQTALDKFLVAGRLGNAELEDLPGVFAKVGGAAKKAGMNMSETLAMLESMSQAQPDSALLGTMANSTLRTFSNVKYMKKAQKATGVRFENKDGSRRNALEVMHDLSAKHQKLKTQTEKLNFIYKAFGETDQKVQEGISMLMDKGSLARIEEYKKITDQARGQAKKDLLTATDNLPDQISRLTAALRQSVDNGFARPFNAAVSSGIKKLLDSKEKGGYGLSGDEMIGGSAAAAAAAYGLYRVGGPMMKKLIGRFGSVGAGVATGKSLEAATGVTPVYVVNMGEGGMDASLGTVSQGGAAAVGSGTLASGAAGLAPYMAIPLAFGGIGIGISKTKGYENADLSKNTMINTRFGRSFMSSARPGKSKLEPALESVDKEHFYRSGSVKKSGMNQMVDSRFGRSFMSDARAQSDEKIKAAAAQFEKANQTLLAEINKTKIDGTLAVNINVSGAAAGMATVNAIGTALGNLKLKTGVTTGGPK